MRSWHLTSRATLSSYDTPFRRTGQTLLYIQCSEQHLVEIGDIEWMWIAYVFWGDAPSFKSGHGSGERCVLCLSEWHLGYRGIWDWFGRTLSVNYKVNNDGSRVPLISLKKTFRAKVGASRETQNWDFLPYPNIVWTVSVLLAGNFAQ